MKNILIRSASYLSCVFVTHVSGSPATSDSLMEEVVITATKKSTGEASQDVPIAVSAFSNDQINAARIEKISDLNSLIPNVRLDKNTSIANATAFAIRGAGLYSSIPTDDPAVGTFVDGVVLGVVNGSNIDAFDLQSVEVLRGPQGTLFGRNVTAGAVVINTEKPSFDPGGEFRLITGTDGRLDVAGKITGPIIGDDLAGKISVLYTSNEGYFENTNGDGSSVGDVFGRQAPLASNYGENESTLIRPSLRWTPNRRVLVDVIAEVSETEGDGNTIWKQKDNTAGYPDSQKPDLSDPEEVNVTTNGANELDYGSLILNARYETEHGAWFWVAGYREMEQYSMVDADGGAADLFILVNDLSQDQVSNEIRWSGNPWSESFDLTAGAYYFNQEIDYIEGRHILGGTVEQIFGGDVDHEALGLFLDTTWRVTDEWEINLGVRYTDEEKSSEISIPSECFLQTSQTWSPVCQPGFSDSEEWDNISPAVTVTYHPSQSTLFYASIKRGYRSGGFNIRNASAFNASPKYDEETVDTYELGMKSDLMPNLRLNAAIFRSEYDGLQRVSIAEDASQRVTNAAATVIEGAEIELSWLPFDNFSILANLGVLHGEYEHLDEGALASINAARQASRLGPGPLPTVDADDLELERIPDYNYALTGVYDLFLGDTGFLTLRASMKYVDDQWNLDSNQLLLSDYTLVDASVTYTSPDNRWRATLFGKNITDENAQLFFSELALWSYFSTGLPERYGVEISYRF